MSICQECGFETTETQCPECGSEILSDPNEILDLVDKDAATSIPNLGAMYRHGKQRGYLSPQSEYSQKITV